MDCRFYQWVDDSGGLLEVAQFESDESAIDHAKQLPCVVTVEKQIENGGSQIIFDGRSQ